MGSPEATVLVERWRQAYNTVRPHSALGYRTGGQVAATLAVDDLRARAVNLVWGVVPIRHSTLTAAVDIQERLLGWMVCSWGPGFSGHVVASGTHPEQPDAMFSAAGAKRTLAMAHKGGGFEATLQAGLRHLVDQLLARDWPREDPTAQRVSAMVIDANWGRSTATVREFARRHPAAAMIHAAHGHGIGANSRRTLQQRHRGNQRRNEQATTGKTTHPQTNTGRAELHALRAPTATCSYCCQSHAEPALRTSSADTPE